MWCVLGVILGGRQHEVSLRPRVLVLVELVVAQPERNIDLVGIYEGAHENLEGSFVFGIYVSLFLVADFLLQRAEDVDLDCVGPAYGAARWQWRLVLAFQRLWNMNWIGFDSVGFGS